MTDTPTATEPTKRHLAKSERTRRRLLDSALQQFATKGYAGTRVADIERAAGLHPGSGAINRHFESKEALARAVIEQLGDKLTELRGRVAEIARIGDHRRELRRIADLIIEFGIENFGAIALLTDVHSFSPQARETFSRVVDLGYLWFFDWVSLRVDDSEVDLEGTAILMAGSLALYGQQSITLGAQPLGVGAERALDVWVDHWADFVANHERPDPHR